MKTHTKAYRGFRFPGEVISHGVWLYHRFTLSFRDVEELLAKRGIAVTHETIRQWCRKFGPEYARRLRRHQGRLGDIWHVDEVFVKIGGERHYLWRAVDQDGDVIDVLVQRYRNTGSTPPGSETQAGITPIRAIIPDWPKGYARFVKFTDSSSASLRYGPLDSRFERGV